MGARTGEQFLERLRKTSRVVWLGNDRVDDVTAHPELAGAARTLAGVFDRQHQHADECLIADPETGEPVSISHMIPRSVEDLKRRNRGLIRISEATVGLMGRTPDYMNVKFACFAAQHGIWAGADHGNEEGAQNLVRFQRRLTLEDLSLTHTIIQPTIDKVTDPRIVGNQVTLHKVGETATGIVVRGARILATLAPFADEIAVYPGLPIPAEATAYALAFAIPVDTPGLIFLCRDSASAPGAHPFDRPLSSRFDEQDAFVIFDNVEVPRDRVFIDGRVDIYNRIRESGIVENLTNQTTIRALTKLEFAYGLATRLAAAINDQSPATQEMLGELLSYVEVTRSAVLLCAEHGRHVGDGVWFPDPRPLMPLRSLLAEWFPRVAEIITLIGSHNLLATPSRRQLDDAALRPLLDEFLHGANGVDAEARAALFRLAWDFVGSGLAGRNLLYERFYLTSASRNRIVGARDQYRPQPAGCARRRHPRRRPRRHTTVGVLTRAMSCRDARERCAWPRVVLLAAICCLVVPRCSVSSPAPRRLLPPRAQPRRPAWCARSRPGSPRRCSASRRGTSRACSRRSRSNTARGPSRKRRFASSSWPRTASTTRSRRRSGSTRCAWSVSMRGSIPPARSPAGCGCWARPWCSSPGSASSRSSGARAARGDCSAISNSHRPGPAVPARVVSWPA